MPVKAAVRTAGPQMARLAKEVQDPHSVVRESEGFRASLPKRKMTTAKQVLARPIRRKR